MIFWWNFLYYQTSQIIVSLCISHYSIMYKLFVARLAILIKLEGGRLLTLVYTPVHDGMTRSPSYVVQI